MRNRTISAVGAAVLLGGLIVPAHALPAVAATDDPVAATSAASVDLVDDEATAETRSLFASLQGIRGEGILFGHQHTTDYGSSFDVRDGESSDVLAATGDYPAVFGFDTLIIEGRERPGSAEASREENALTLAQSISEADALGGIATLSAHIENFATGGDFYDTSGDALRAVLPAGEKNAELTAYLDLIALAADNAIDADGNAIPIVFRPWHENAGSWFWWGAAFGSPGEYAELFRYTVEYLRDVKDVHNLLYAFSPGGGFGGDEDLYLRTYPGDDFVDVLGYDTYDASASSTFLDGLVDDLGMISRLADDRGKVSAFTEFGITGGVQADGSNANTSWYTDVLEAIEADPDASRSAYMLTWANFGGTSTPYTPTGGEMLADFLAFHDDPYTLFAGEFDASAVQADAVAEAPTVHLASPASGSRVTSGPVTLRASVRGYADADQVVLTVDGTEQSIELSAPADGGLWWTGQWDVPDELLNNSTRGLTLHVLADGVELTSSASTIIAGARPELAPGVVDDFEGYGDDEALRSQYVQYGANTLSLEQTSVGAGSGALRLDYAFQTQTYTGIGTQVTADWSDFTAFEAWVDPDASGNKLVLQIVADGVAFEAYPSLASDEASLVSIPFDDWRPAAWDTGNADRRLTAETLAEVSQFNIYVNAVDGGAVSGSIVVDELRAVQGDPTYSDVPFDHADHDAIEWLHDEVIDLGDKKGRFHPTKSLKDDEATALFAAYDAQFTDEVKARLLPVVVALWQVAGSPEPTADHVYRDVPDADADAVSWAVEEGIIDVEAAAESAKKAPKFGVNGRVSRAEIARWLQRADAYRTAHSALVISDFADGADGWDIASWETNGGTAAAGDGVLLVEAGDAGNWLSRTASVDLTGRTELLVELSATDGIDTKAALQLGADWTWCETGQAGWTESAGTVSIDLTTLSADCQAMLDDVRGINLYFSEGHHEVDAISAR